jgi:hypothetical protein
VIFSDQAIPLLWFLQGFHFEKRFLKIVSGKTFSTARWVFLFLNHFLKIPAQKGFSQIYSKGFHKSFSLKRVYAKTFFKTLLVVQSSRFSPDLGDAPIPTKRSACRRYGRHDQELHTPLLPRMYALIWSQFSCSGPR